MILMTCFNNNILQRVVHSLQMHVNAPKINLKYILDNLYLFQIQNDSRAKQERRKENEFRKTTHGDD